jgi:hypothetical protein
VPGTPGPLTTGRAAADRPGIARRPDAAGLSTVAAVAALRGSSSCGQPLRWWHGATSEPRTGRVFPVLCGRGGAWELVPIITSHQVEATSHQVEANAASKCWELLADLDTVHSQFKSAAQFSYVRWAHSRCTNTYM